MMPNYHTSTTPQAHVDAVQNAMTSLEGLPFVRSAWADDWGRYSNFSLFVDVKHVCALRYGRPRRGLLDPKGLAKIKASILKELSDKFPHQNIRIRSTSREGTTYNIDLDFYKFDAEGNSFPNMAQTTPKPDVTCLVNCSCDPSVNHWCCANHAPTDAWLNQSHR